ncbi:MAG TPA: SEC-C metal-binding domain-containing protein [Bradyrhizobium sp.]|nr:SEC-C metal-binding domain-containing protein [Bradyrhizobium sp.]
MPISARPGCKGLHSVYLVIATRPAAMGRFFIDGGVSCARSAISKTSPAFSITRKRRKSFPSETHVKRGRRFVHGDVELAEKLGRNDLCPCGSGRRFQGVLPEIRRL